jgi:hypothetical protein
MLLSLVTWSVYDAGMQLFAAFPKNIEFLNDSINSMYLNSIVRLSPYLLHCRRIFVPFHFCLILHLIFYTTTPPPPHKTYLYYTMLCYIILCYDSEKWDRQGVEQVRTLHQNVAPSIDKMGCCEMVKEWFVPVIPVVEG